MAPAAGGNINGLLGALKVIGVGTDTMNVDDLGSPATNTGTLTSTALTGLGTGGITYSGLAALNISLGSGANTFTVLSVNAATTTSINVQRATAATSITTISGVDVVNVGSLAPATGGNLNGIQGALTVTGDGSGTLNVDDTGSTGTNTGTLTGTALRVWEWPALLTAAWLR